MIGTLEQRFWSKVKKGDGCWLWTGAEISPGGYGHLGYKGKMISAHRASWKIHFGDIPDGLFVLHSCDNRPCVNPAHLRLGTHQDNIDDRELRKRNYFGSRRHTELLANGGIIAKLTLEQAKEIKSKYVPRIVTATMLAQEYGVTHGTIQSIIYGWRWVKALQAK